jgi:tripartite-type tricarboxylate transporter receptor subunit TctC
VWEGYIQEMVKDPNVIEQLKKTGAWARYVGSDALRKEVQATGDQMRSLWK